MTSISTERKVFTAAGIPVRTREQWGAAHDYTGSRAVVEPAQAFFLHIAVVHDRSDLVGSEDQVMRSIEAIGRARFGKDRLSSGISYNAAVFNTARFVYEAQPLGRRGAHTVNDKLLRTCAQPGCPNRGRAIPRGGGATGNNLNVNVRSMVLPQNVGDPVTAGQVDLIARWAAAQIQAGLARSDARWHGHRCVAWKDCPAPDGWAALPRIQQLTDRYVKEGLDEDMALTPEQLAAIADAVWSADCIPNDSGNAANPVIQAKSALDRLLKRSNKLSASPPASQASVDALAARLDQMAPAETVVVTTGKPLSALDIATAASAAGFLDEELVVATAIALAESNGYEKAVGGPNRGTGPAQGSYDFGLWQINGYWHKPTDQQKFVAVENAKMARAIFTERGNWTAWSVYNSGSYMTRMAEAQGAVAALLATRAA